jgi:hypothetical protein
MFAFRAGVALFFCFLVLGCSGCSLFSPTRTQAADAVPERAVTVSEEQQVPAKVSDLQEGYALLGKLLGDEKNVSKLLIIKRERPALHDLVQNISSSCKLAYTHLAELRGEGNLKHDGLPVIETAARKLISKQRAKEFIVEGGKDFDLAMLVSQNEALTYASALAQALSGLEPDVAQKEWLLKLSKTLSDLQKQVYQTVFENYSWQRK